MHEVMDASESNVYVEHREKVLHRFREGGT